MAIKTESYWNIIKTSWKTTWTQPFAIGVGIYSYLLLILYSYVFSELGQALFGEEFALTTGSIIGLFIFALTTLILFFALAIHTSSMQIATYTLFAKNKPRSIRRIFSQAKKIYWLQFRYSMLALLIAFLPLIIILSPIFVKGVGVFGELTSYLLLFVAVVYILFILSWMMYAIALIGDGNKGVLNTLNSCWKLLTQHTSLQLGAFFLYFLITIILTAFSGLISYLFVLFGQEGLSNAIGSLLQIIIGVIMSLFLFLSYHKKIKKVAHV